MKLRNNERKTTPVLVVLFIILAAALFTQFTLFKDSNNPNQNRIGEKTPITSTNNQEKRLEENTVIIDFGNGQKIERTVKAKTPYQTLEMVAGNEGYQITTKQYKYGLMVEEINRLKNTPEKYWLFSVNGKPGKIAADRFQLNSGDLVEWKYTSVK